MVIPHRQLRLFIGIFLPAWESERRFILRNNHAGLSGAVGQTQRERLRLIGLVEGAQRINRHTEMQRRVIRYITIRLW